MKEVRLWVATALLVGALAPVGAEPSSSRDLVRAAVEQMREAGGLEIGDASLAAISLLGELYRRRDFRLAWTRQDNVGALLRLLEESEAEGLDPQDYNFSTLQELRVLSAAPASDPTLLVGFDLLLTDSLARLAYHLRFGKVVPDQLDANWNLGREATTKDVVQLVQDAIDSDSLESFGHQRASHPRQRVLREVSSICPGRAPHDRSMRGAGRVIPGGRHD